MRFIISPAELAARSAPPDAGPVTAAIEKRAIVNTVVTRAEITYADAVEVTIDGGGGEGRPVVTGHVPKVGTVLKAGSVALEVAGRPVIVLPGDLPAYRTLGLGMKGPDVSQLKASLAGMGYAVGDTSSDTFDADTAAAVGALYEQLGYPATPRSPDAPQAVKTAERGLRDAQAQLAQARSALDAAAAARAKSVASEQAAVATASDAVSDAEAALGEAQEAALPTLPSSEALFLAGLPRRVDAAKVARGDLLSGSPMTVSGATLAIIGSISSKDAELLSPGLKATYPGPDGAELTATISKIEDAPTGKTPGSGPDGGEGGEGESGGGATGTGGKTPDTQAKRKSVRLDPGKLTDKQLEALRGASVRLSIPVAATKGEVLAIPIAALSTGAGGENRVEILTGKASGKDTSTETVVVTPGLAADGYVEITSKDPRITAGTPVVVGR
ncbi:hypothetical protein JD292_01595 [Leucobacter sp. CSA2]|uniref:Peptidoglycan binding-like domain-containing protein n=2 Tax=Leucobacter edaphi TaxID=2796472 RepID=A0A934QA74_9MICO|nr:hypothetical protein [Leucobacter edaphi]MBK0420776.1 hypothetical protein [Leucobacter edaphi]